MDDERNMQLTSSYAGARMGMFNRPILLASIVAAGLAFLTVVTWQAARDARKQNIRQHTEKSVEFVLGSLKTRVETHLAMGRLIRREWMNGLIQDQQTFTKQAMIKLEQFSALQALNWISSDGIIQWAAPLQGNEPALGLNIFGLDEVGDLLRAAIRENEVTVSGPRELTQGGRGIVAYVPVQKNDAIIGVVNVVAHVAPLLDGAIDNYARGNFRVRIMDSDRLVAEFGEAPYSEDFGTSRVLSFENRTWSVTAYPNVAYVASFNHVIERLVLGIGLVITLGVSYLVYLTMLRHQRMRRSEERFADFANVSSDYFWESDENLRYSYFSPQMERVTGIPVETLIGKTREEIGAPGADPEAYLDLLRRLKAHEPFRDFEVMRVLPNGETVALSISAKPVFDEKGKFAGYRGIGRDITSDKQSKLILNQALATSERASRAKSEFMATMSHEFRTPLNAIIGFSELMREEYFGPIGSAMYRQYADDIRQSGHHLLNIINDILDISAIEANKRSFSPEPCHLPHIVEECSHTFAPNVENNAVRFEFDFDEDMPPCVIDKRSFVQIVLNIVSNAVKFSPVDGIVQIALRHDGDHVAMSVRDNGIGIPSDRLWTLTDPFSRVQTDPHIAATGTGLGLSIVESLTDAHGGTLHIESVEGEGTTVVVTLPIEADERLSAD